MAAGLAILLTGCHHKKVAQAAPAAPAGYRTP
jgi:hypothetical protein